MSFVPTCRNQGCSEKDIPKPILIPPDEVVVQTPFSEPLDLASIPWVCGACGQLCELVEET